MTDNHKPKVAALYTFPQTVVEDIGRLMRLAETGKPSQGSEYAQDF